MNRAKRAIVLLTLIALLLPAAAAAQTATSIQINNTEVTEGETSLSLSVYFTVIAETGLPISNPHIDHAEFIQLDNEYRTTGPVSHAETPFYIAMVLDASGSMARSGEELRQAASQAISSAPAQGQIAIFRFNDQIDLLQDFTNNNDRLNNAIAQVEPVDGAGTCLYDAAYQAIEHLATAPNGRRALILFTDGRDEVAGGGPCSQHVYDEVVSLALDPAYNVPIHTIGLSASSSNINTVELENMAATTRGFSQISTSGNLSSGFDVIMEALNSQYVATAEFFPTSGQHNVALQFFLTAETSLPANTSFISSRDYLLPASASLDDVQYDAAANVYRLFMYFNSPSLIDHLRIAVWDSRGGVQISQEVYRDLTSEQSFQISTAGMEADKEYEFRIEALTAAEAPVTDASGAPISIIHEVRYEPVIIETELTIPSVSLQAEALVVNIQLVDGGVVTGFEGWLVNQDTNVTVTGTAFQAPAGSPSITIPLTGIAEGTYTVVLRALDANNKLVTETYYEGVEYVPPVPPSRISVLREQILNGLRANWWILLLIVVVIVAGIGAVILLPMLERRRTGTPILQGKLESNLGGKASPINLTTTLERPAELGKARPAPVRPAAERPSAPRPAPAQPAAPRPSAERPSAPRPAPAQPAAPRPSAERPSAPRPAPAQPAAPRPSAERPSAPRPAPAQPIPPRPSAERPSAPRPALPPQPASPRQAAERPSAPRPMPQSHPASAPGPGAVLKVAFSPDPAQHGQIIRLGQGGVTLGRENCEVQFADQKISRRHASITFNPGPGYYTITDLGSANGVTLNGARLAPNVPTPLPHGAIILLGPDTRLIFERGG